MIRMSSYFGAKVQMTAMVLPHSLGTENLGVFSLNDFDIFESPNFFERVVNISFRQGYQVIRGNQVCILQKGKVI